MADKVYEGRAELNIQPFLDALKRMEDQAGTTGNNISQIFRNLETSLGGSITALKGHLASVATEVSSIRTAVTQANTALRSSAQVQQQASQQAQSAARQSQQAAQQETAARRARAIEQQLAQKNILDSQQEGLVLQAGIHRNEVSQINRFSAEKVLALKDENRKVAAELQKGIAEQQRVRQQALQIAARQQNNIAQGVSAPGGLTEEVYQKALQRADRAYKAQTELERQLTSVVRSETAIRNTIQAKGIQEMETTTRAGLGRVGTEYTNLTGRIRNAFITAQGELKRFEDSINSIYRAGAQLTQLGSQMTAFAAGIGFLGVNLAQSAGDFDFWMRRATAASKAAQDATGETVTAAERALISTESFRERALEIGREVGVVSPKEIAESWFVYQAALGDTIRTTEDLQLAQHNVNSLLRAAIVTGTSYDQTIRGATSALKEFGLGSESLDFALSLMVNTTQVTQAEFSDVLETFKNIGPQARRLGLDITQVSTAMSLLAEQNLRGSRAGRLLASGLTNLIAPSNKVDETLQQLFITNQGLEGSWRSVLTAGGELIPLFDQVAENGEKQLGILHKFADATQDMSNYEREVYLATIFGKDAGKVWSTLVADYADAQKAAQEAGSGTVNSFELLAQAMRDPQKQLKAFSDQWEEVAGGIKIRMGQVLFSFTELKDQLGTIIAGRLIPFLERLRVAAEHIRQWAEANPEAAASIVDFGIKAVAFTAILGPLVAGLGLVIQGIAGLALAAKTISTFGGALIGVVNATPLLGGLSAAIGGLLSPIGLVVVAVAALYAAWRFNIFGLQEVLGSVAGNIGTMLKSVGEALLSVVQILIGVFSGNNALVEAGARSLALRLIEIFLVLPAEIGGSLLGLVNDLEATFVRLAQNAVIWGRNLAVSLANGLIEGGQYLLQAAFSLAETVARLFRSFSPPKYGPLRDIQKWGTNLVNSLIDGMHAADFGAITEVAGRIGEAIKKNIEEGLVVPTTYAASVGTANNLVDDMLSIVRDGGRVNQDFFATLKTGLGEWYGYITQIALAYQDVYANERQLSIEKEKLAAIKAQRQELDRQNQARQDALDLALGGTDSTGLRANADAIVDPLTPEGQAKIAEMRRNLSREDFQNWVAFQKKLWEQRADIEDKNLKQQEEATQATVDTTEAQLDAAQKQYDLYVQMYEYALKMYNLAEEQQRLEEQAQQDKDKLGGTFGTPEDLSAQLAEIAKVIGQDQALQTEDTIRADSRDDIEAIGRAADQQEREENRLSELEKLNRRKRAEFEVALIHATNAEEQQRIKEQKDAWDAAYRQEKARLQERLQFAREVQDATERMADASLAGRIGPQQEEFQRQIAQLLGDQTDAIEDANQLKAAGGDLDHAQIEARTQLREEERKLRDLQAFGDQKRLEFEQRIREAAGDDEKLRRIKEEQQAWDSAYKRALEAQQLRVELARRAQQDLGDEASAVSKLAGGSSAAGAGGIGDLGLSDAIAPKVDDILSQLKIDWGKLDGLGDGEQRPTLLKSIKALDDLTRAIQFLGDESIPVETKLKLVGDSIKEAFGWDDWGDAIFPGFSAWAKETDEGFNTWAAGIKTRLDTWAQETDEGFNTWASGIKTGLDTWATDTDTRFNTWAAGVGESWNSFWAGVEVRWELFKQGFQEGWNKYWDDLLRPFYATLGLLYVLWVDYWNKFGSDWKAAWEWLQARWSEFKIGLQFAWGVFWSDLTAKWNAFKEGMLWLWDGFWKDLTLKWEAFKNGINAIWPLVTAAWEAFKSGFLLAWSTYWADVERKWIAFRDAFVTGWTAYWADLEKKWIAFRDGVKTLWDAFLLDFQFKWNAFIEGLGRLRDAIDPLWNKVSGFFANLETTINRLVSIGKSLLGVKQDVDKEQSSGGGGSFAHGLNYVPYDMFRAYLHKGEMVLTAAQATAYRSMQSAVLGAAVLSQQSSTVSNTSTSSGGNRKVEINVGRIDATNPDEGRALLSQLAFYGG